MRGHRGEKGRPVLLRAEWGQHQRIASATFVDVGMLEHLPPGIDLAAAALRLDGSAMWVCGPGKSGGHHAAIRRQAEGARPAIRVSLAAIEKDVASVLIALTVGDDAREYVPRAQVAVRIEGQTLALPAIPSDGVATPWTALVELRRLDGWTMRFVGGAILPPSIASARVTERPQSRDESFAASRPRIHRGRRPIILLLAAGVTVAVGVAIVLTDWRPLGRAGESETSRATATEALAYLKTDPVLTMFLNTGADVAQQDPASLSQQRCSDYATQLGTSSDPSGVISAASNVRDPVLAELLVDAQVALRDVLASCFSGDQAGAPAASEPLRLVLAQLMARKMALERVARQ